MGACQFAQVGGRHQVAVVEQLLPTTALRQKRTLAVRRVTRAAPELRVPETS